MSTATINVRLDKATKDAITDFADQLGMPVSVLIVATLKQVLRTGKVEFNTNLEPSDELQRIMREAREDYAANRNITRYDSVEDMRKDLASS